MARRGRRRRSGGASPLDEHAAALAERLVRQIERGTAPWVKAWGPGKRRLPANVRTGKAYRGGNSVALASAASLRGFADHRWGTYRQIRQMGGQVRKGERGEKVLFWQFERQRKATGADGRQLRDEKGKPAFETVRLRSPWVRRYTVFNAEQAKGLPEAEPPAPAWEAVRRAERVLEASGAEIRHGAGVGAYYNMQEDFIALPPKDQFREGPAYYQSALHELGHWTGHPDRLNRETLLRGMTEGIASGAYAREELRAEISSMITGDRLALGHDPKRSENYVGAWAERLRKDPAEIYRASRDAQAISDYTLELARMRAPEPPRKAEPAEPAWRPPGVARGEQGRFWQREPAGRGR